MSYQDKINLQKNSIKTVHTNGEVSIKIDHRCVSCNKLLGVENFALPSFDIKCPRCGIVNPIIQDLERQVIITDKEGVILYINKRVEKVTGYSAEEILGNRPSLWGNQMSGEFYKELWAEILNQKKSTTVKLTNKTKDGKLYDVVLRVSPLLDENGEVEFFLGIETLIEEQEKIDGKSRILTGNGINPDQIE